MIAKETYYVDEAGKITTDAKKGVRRIARKGHHVNPATAKMFGLDDSTHAAKKTDAEPKAEPKPAAKPTSVKTK